MCNCPQPELCELLNRHIVGRLAELFQENSDRGEKYRLKWIAEAGLEREDVQHLIPSRGLGDTVAKFLHTMGVTKRRVKRVTGNDCGCEERQEKLNELYPKGE